MYTSAFRLDGGSRSEPEHRCLSYGGMTAVEFTGKHYDMGNKLKVAEAQVELALQHPEIGEAFRAYLKEFCKTL